MDVGMRGSGRLVVAVLLGLGAVVGCGGGDDSGDGAEAEDAGDAEETAAGGCEPARPMPEGGVQGFAHGGEDRQYLLDLPPDYDGTTPVPLVLNFHGFSGSKEQTEATTGLGEAGAARGMAVVTPDALGEPRQWNMFGDPAQADDFAFVPALLADLTERLCVDADRVYAAGHSNGSAFTGFLACREPYPFAAVALVSATVPSGCAADVAPGVLAIHGTADPVVLYDGGTGGSNQAVPAAPEVMAGYAEQYGCGEPQEDSPHEGVERVTYAGCTSGGEVVLDTVVGGTHPWPGTDAARADTANSEAGRTFPATEEILAFFERHQRASD